MDVAVKVVGVGSVGTRCGIVLMMADDDDAMFLQIKEARVSVLEPYAGASAYQNRGQRVVAGQRLMQSASDMFLGWTKGAAALLHPAASRHEDQAVVEIFDPIAMTRYAHWCGRTLARAHAKSGDAAMISGYLGNADKFDEATADFAEAYADQNERDYRCCWRPSAAAGSRSTPSSDPAPHDQTWATTTAPAAPISPRPIGSRSRVPPGRFFSAAISAASASIQPTLPMPTTNISSISAQQQPTQKTP